MPAGIIPGKPLLSLPARKVTCGSYYGKTDSHANMVRQSSALPPIARRRSPAMGLPIHQSYLDVQLRGTVTVATFKVAELMDDELIDALGHALAEHMEKQT